ncbi:GNAT family N-acetyltransferase [bacterium]|nr:MAG: GNAT family N-acetyltransferase [bacterium]
MIPHATDGLTLRRTRPEDGEAVAALQPLAFPPPFDPGYHWRARHIRAHTENFPAGQYVVEDEGRVIASSSNVLLNEETWTEHARTGAHPYSVDFSPPEGSATTLYGADIAVHPEYRRRGVARMIYTARYALVRELGLIRYGTACRMPDYAAQNHGLSPRDYAAAVVEGTVIDRTMTPLLRQGLTFLNVVPSTWPDIESGQTSRSYSVRLFLV